MQPLDPPFTDIAMRIQGNPTLYRGASAMTTEIEVSGTRLCKKPGEYRAISSAGSFTRKTLHKWHDLQHLETVVLRKGIVSVTALTCDR